MVSVLGYRSTDALTARRSCVEPSDITLGVSTVDVTPEHVTTNPAYGGLLSHVPENAAQVPPIADLPQCRSSNFPRVVGLGPGHAGTVHSAPIDILVVCTGNTCRSPIAEAVLQAKLDTRGVAAVVRSAGTLPWHGPASEGARTAAEEFGLDLSGHRSQRLTGALVADADLILGMTRSHVWTVVNHAPDAADRAFLVGELARLGRRIGVREPAEPVRDWAARVAALRPDSRVPGQAQDEVTDPAGEPVEVYRATLVRLDDQLERVARLVAGE